MSGSVESWLIGALSPTEEDKEQIKVTVRLEASDYYELRELAKKLGMTPTGVASGLLTNAITDATHFMRKAGVSSAEEILDGVGIPVADDEVPV